LDTQLTLDWQFRLLVQEQVHVGTVFADDLESQRRPIVDLHLAQRRKLDGFVFEVAPTPIREINTEIPEWLAGLVSSKRPTTVPKGCIIRRRPTRLVEFQAALGHLSANHEPEG